MTSSTTVYVCLSQTVMTDHGAAVSRAWPVARPSDEGDVTLVANTAPFMTYRLTGHGFTYKMSRLYSSAIVHVLLSHSHNLFLSLGFTLLVHLSMHHASLLRRHVLALRFRPAARRLGRAK